MKIALRADAGYLTAELGGDEEGRVTANRSQVGAWEVWTVERHGDAVALLSCNGRYLCAELAGGDEVHANRERQGVWELFTPTGMLADGSRVQFITANGASKLAVDPSGEHPVHAKGNNGATFVVEVVSADVVTPPPVDPTRLMVDRQRFRTATGYVFLKGASMFTLFQRFLDGENVRPQLEQMQGFGANAIRVFGMFHWININEFGKAAFKPQDYGDRFYAETPAFCRLAAECGLYVYWSCFPDNDLIMPNQAQRRAHYDRWVPLLEGEPNTLFELTNEQDAHSYNAVDARLFPKPQRMTSCAGSYGDTGGFFPPPYWDFFDFHTPRSYPKQIKDSCVADAPDFLAGRAILLGEPDRFGSNGNTNTEQARMVAGTALGTALGIVFHSRNGVRGECFDDVTTRSAAAFFGVFR